ncbi:MAG: sigma-70 family RNA polymerase sigma factor [Streptomyces sp.]|nr:sigma-70 family RNA polymerase sigma factor [Streptomyces sp.]
MYSPAVSRPRTSAVAAVPAFSEQLDDLMRDMCAQPPGSRRAAVREHVIRRLLPLARRVARRYQRHGEDLDDLVQVAAVGLVKAVDSFDPRLGHAFLSYCLPKITGELRRHVRDRTAVIRLPRPLQEASGPVIHAIEELEQRHGGRRPTAAQIAEHTGLDCGRVLATLRAVHECRLRSLDEPADHDDGLPLASLLGAADAALEHVVDSVALASVVKRLPRRDQRVLYLRFYREQSQQQIANAVGVSQMQVSRILRRCCDRLREALLGTGPPRERPAVPERAVPARTGQRRERPDRAKPDDAAGETRCRARWQKSVRVRRSGGRGWLGPVRGLALVPRTPFRRSAYGDDGTQCGHGGGRSGRRSGRTVRQGGVSGGAAGRASGRSPP